MSRSHVETWFGLRAAARKLGISPNTLSRRIGAAGDEYASYLDETFLPDGIRQTETWKPAPLWSEARIDEIRSTLAARQLAEETA